MAELASPGGEREQKVTADMLDKVRAAPSCLGAALARACLRTGWASSLREPGVHVASALHTPAT